VTSPSYSSVRERSRKLAFRERGEKVQRSQPLVVVHVLLESRPHSCIFFLVYAIPCTEDVINKALVVEDKVFSILGEDALLFMECEVYISIHGGRGQPIAVPASCSQWVSSNLKIVFRITMLRAWMMLVGIA
jgi:hypothetical protein